LDPVNPDRLLMEHVLESQLRHRDAAQLCELFRGSRFGEPAALQREPSNVNWSVTSAKAG
jgi:hypothetical protein